MPASSIRNGKVTITTTGTSVPLAASARQVLSVLVVALDANAQKITVGGSDAPTVTPQNSVLLAAGESVPFGACDLHSIVINGTAADGVAYLTEE